jgi:hypothetical protein
MLVLMLLPMVGAAFGHPLTAFDIFISFIWLIFLLYGSAFINRPAYSSEVLHCKCPYCDRDIASNVEWTCGFCPQDNSGKKLEFREHLLDLWNQRNTAQAPSFLEHCIGCSRACPSFVCYHCGVPILIVEGGSSRNPARKFGTAAAREIKEDLHKREMKTLDEQTEKLIKLKTVQEKQKEYTAVADPSVVEEAVARASLSPKQQAIFIERYLPEKERIDRDRNLDFDQKVWSKRLAIARHLGQLTEPDDNVRSFLMNKSQTHIEREEAIKEVLISLNRVTDAKNIPEQEKQRERVQHQALATELRMAAREKFK